MEQHLALGLEVEVRECRAHLADVLLDADRADEAAALARAVAAEVLEVGHPPGGIEPGRQVLLAHRVLRAVGDPLADRLPAAAAQLVHDRATAVADEEVRAALLATPVLRDLAALAAQSSSSTGSPTRTVPGATTAQ